jgi:hypothetical protein
MRQIPCWPDRLRLLTVLCLASFAGCGTAPLSYVDGNLYHRALLNRYPARIISIDGDFSLQNPRQVSPGPHTFIIEAQPVAGFRGPVQKALALNFKPYTRYYLAADRGSPLTQDWSLAIDYEEPVAGCDPAKELTKTHAEVGIPVQPVKDALSAAG